MLASSSGEISLTDGSSLDYVITSERYRKWDAAQRALSKDVAKRFGQILNPRSPSEQSINRAVAYLEGQPAARQAIEGAGMSVRDFVVMTVALEQQMQLANSRGAAPEYPIDPMIDSAYPPAPPVAAYPQPYPANPDPYPAPTPAYPPPATYPPSTTYPAPAPVPVAPPRPSVVYPRPADSARPDTVRPARHDSISRDTAVRRDSLLVRRDTLALPPRRDTTSPPDSVRVP